MSSNYKLNHLNTYLSQNFCLFEFGSNNLERRINVFIVLPFAFLNRVDPRLQDYLVLFAEQ